MVGQRRGIGRVADGKGDARRGKGVERLHEAVTLTGEEIVAIRALVGGGKVGEHTLRHQGGQTADGDGARHRILPLTGDAEAETTHARIQLNMHLDGDTCRYRRLGQLATVLGGIDALGKILAGQDLGASGGSVAQDEHGTGHPETAQLERLLDVRDSEPIRPHLLIQGSQLAGTVTVGIGLNHTAEFHARRQSTADGGVIVTNSV